MNEKDEAIIEIKDENTSKDTSTKIVKSVCIDFNIEEL